MSRWTSSELDKIGTAEELGIASVRRDGTLSKPVTIWVVRTGDDLYVRSYKGGAGAWFYFVHSFFAVPDDASVIAATATHGENRITAAVARDNVFASQFHPEKSQQNGLNLIAEFLR